jgi:hypothetical protein
MGISGRRGRRGRRGRGGWRGRGSPGLCLTEALPTGSGGVLGPGTGIRWPMGWVPRSRGAGPCRFAGRSRCADHSAACRVRCDAPALSRRKSGGASSWWPLRRSGAFFALPPAGLPRFDNPMASGDQWAGRPHRTIFASVSCLAQSTLPPPFYDSPQPRRPRDTHQTTC